MALDRVGGGADHRGIAPRCRLWGSSGIEPACLVASRRLPRLHLCGTKAAMHEPLPARPGAIFREFAAFLRRPQVLTPSGLRAPGAWRRWTQLVILQIGVLVLVLL